MSGITTQIDAPYDVCAGCNRPIQVHPKRGGSHIRTLYEGVSPNGDISEVALTFHSWDCLTSTYHIEKWDGNLSFVRWAADRVRSMLGIKVREIRPDSTLKAIEGGMENE